MKRLINTTINQNENSIPRYLTTIGFDAILQQRPLAMVIGDIPYNALIIGLLTCVRT